MTDPDSYKRMRGRPRIDATLVGVRMPPDLLEALDRFARDDGRSLSRPEALRVAFREWAKAKGLISKGPRDEGKRPDELTSDNDG